MSLLIERAHALREAALAAASAAVQIAVTAPPVSVPTPAPAPSATAVPDPGCETPVGGGGPLPIPEAVLPPSFAQQRVAQKPVSVAKSKTGASLAKQDVAVSPAPKPAFLLPISVAMTVGGGLYYMLPRVMPGRFTRDEAGHSKRLMISIAGALILAYIAYRRLSA